MRHHLRATLPTLAVTLGVLYATGATAATWTMASPSAGDSLLIAVKDGNGGGHGGGNGGGHGGGNGGGNGGGPGGGNGNGGGSDNGSSHGLGSDKSADATGKTAAGRDKAVTVSAVDDDDDTIAVTRTDRHPRSASGSFANHGQRVSSMVHLSKSLGYGARTGAMQANFGTPQETGIRALQERIARLEADPTADPRHIAALKHELAERIDAVKPGVGPTGSWETTNLDVDGNGVVDRRDEELARLGFHPFD